MCLVTLQDRIYLAPITDPKHILDVGKHKRALIPEAEPLSLQCRRHWNGNMGNVNNPVSPHCCYLTFCRDMSDKFPDAEVIGTDLSPISPAMLPGNFRFEIDDATSPWIYPEDHFDFIHIRGLLGAVGDWPYLYKQAFTHLAPRGYIEHVEYSCHVRSAEDNLSSDSPWVKWGHNAVRSGELHGKTLEVAENMASWIREAGFVDVVERRFKWPIGPWSSDPRHKDIGRWNLLNWEEGSRCHAHFDPDRPSVADSVQWRAGR